MARATALPLYVTVAETLTRDIASGRLADGVRLPPERDLAAEMGIAVGTLRKALSELERRGLLNRVQGSGNYVRAGLESAGVYALFRLERTQGGGMPTSEVLSIGRLAKPAGAPEFGAAPEAHRIRRMRRLSGEAAAVEEIWVDAVRAPGFDAADLSESLYLHYRRAFDLWIGAVTDRVSVSPAPDWVPAGFGPAPGAPCGHVERLAHDRDGAAVEWSRTWFDPDRAAYVARHR